MNHAKYQILNSFILKIIAIVTMTFDHIGAFLVLYFPSNDNILLTGSIFRIIGRLSFPLIAILFAEAMRYTHDRQHYLSRLGLMTVIILAVEITITYAFNIHLLNGNIFLTLLCSASFIYLYERDDKWQFLAILPITIIILSLISDIQGASSFWPSYLKADYSLYGFLLCTGSYFAYKISDKRVLTLTKGERNLEELKQFGYYRTFTNLMWIALLVVVNVFFWAISYINPGADIYNASSQTYSLIAIVLILLYNGEKGYQSKKLQYSFYFYYPIHLLIIFLAFYCAMGMPPIW